MQIHQIHPYSSTSRKGVTFTEIFGDKDPFLVTKESLSPKLSPKALMTKTSTTNLIWWQKGNKLSPKLLVTKLGDKFSLRFGDKIVFKSHQNWWHSLVANV